MMFNEAFLSNTNQISPIIPPPVADSTASNSTLNQRDNNLSRLAVTNKKIIKTKTHRITNTCVAIREDGTPFTFKIIKEKKIQTVTNSVRLRILSAGESVSPSVRNSRSDRYTSTTVLENPSLSQNIQNNILE